MLWNPFFHLQETTYYPTARLIRSSFKQRMRDTFKVFYGDIFRNNLGIIDYIFPFSRLSTAILLLINRGSNDNANTTDIILSASLFIIWSTPTILLSIPKLIVASALTLVLSPVVALVHFWFKSDKEKLVNQIKHLKIQLYKSNIDQHIDQLDDQKDLEDENELAQALPTREFDSLSIRPIYKYPEGSACTYTEYALTDTTTSRILLLGIFAIKPLVGVRPSDALGKPLALVKITPQNSTPIKAILTTNMFWATEHLENVEALTQVEEVINQVQPRFI
ncbi:MAG: hypothetical protein V4501_02900 [Pseudomonadota bacterium]